MIRMPELSTNYFWRTGYTSSLLDSIKPSTYLQTKSDYDFQSLQKVSRLSVQNYQDQQDQYRNSIANLNGSIGRVNSSARSLTAANLFNQKYVSADAGTAITGEAKIGATAAQYNVGISQIATAQSNEGKNLSASAYGGVATGISTFGIKVGSGAERQVSVSVLATDNYGQALKKFAKAINNSDTGVQAEVKTKNNMQYLSVTAKDTGAVNSFTLRDINGTGATDLQLSHKVTDAADAQYTVNGTSYQSAGNQVSLDNGNVSLKLNTVTTGTIKVNVGEDDNKIVHTVKNFIEDYNDLNDILSNSDNITKRGDRALNSVESLVGRSRKMDFSAIGISLDQATGELKLDEKKLSEALASNSGKVKSLLTGGSSLGKMVERVSKEMSSNPVNSYLKPPSTLENLSYASSYSSSGWMFQQNNLAQGLFLNMMV